MREAGSASAPPVALLIEEGGAWSFVSLDPDITRECLEDLELPPVLTADTCTESSWF